MKPSEKKKPRLKFSHIFIAVAFLIILIHFAIGGFAPHLMVLMPAFPFLLLSVLPISWRILGHSDRQGMIGAGLGALASVLPVTAIFAYDMVTGWKGGADIGLGLLYMFLPLYSVVFMALGYFIGEITALMRQRNFRRLPDVLKTISLFIGIGLCFYFLFGSFSDYNLWRYYEKIDPSAAELYEIGFWLSIIKAGASLLVPLVIYLITRRNNKR
ncbi:MAG: hypothetical protein OET21_03790 [Desulfobacterales bacterium]|jgi:hypothetical protein|nr:hypothetical protein [Desulfobacterales bacterium]MDH3877815.1 hypothetical protein [Desulfobacterales bacterium]